jgi:pimeloyl-ACP methyl ester carboxylesterase
MTAPKRCFFRTSEQPVPDLEISLCGELRVVSDGSGISLPASRKARGLLAFLVATGRPHRRERLCEMFWNLPDDPKAALRWSLSKLRGVVDAPDRARIVADRERVHFDCEGVRVDVNEFYARLRQEHVAVEELEPIARQLDMVFLDGLDGAGGDSFDAWLASERNDAQAARAAVLRRLATHADIDPISAQKWRRLWREADPLGAAADESRSKALFSTLDASDIDSETTLGRGNEDMPAHARTSGAANPRARELRTQRIGFCKARDGTKIAYATAGSGPPLFKAANWLNHLEFDWASPIWGETFAAMARGRTFIRYDERGSGLSDWDVADLGFNAFVEDLEAVVDTLHLDRFPLVGVSQGCAVSIEYAVRHPERVTGLILIGGYAAGWRHMASPEEQERRKALIRLTEVGWGTDNAAYRHVFSKTFMPDASNEDLAWFDEFQRKTASPKNAARFQDAFGNIDVRHRLAQVQAPTIVLHSEQDHRNPIDGGRAMAAGIPGALFVPLESRNHIPLEHEPAWQVCIDAIARFLAENRI